MGRAQIISEATECIWVFDNAEVSLYPSLIKIISKLDWAVSDLGKRASLINAEKCISPFTVIDLSEKDISVIKQHYEDLQRAMAVSAN